MSQCEIIAIFDSADSARAAAAQLDARLNIGAGHMRISADRVLHIDTPPSELDRVSAFLQAAGALDITYTERARDSGWMGHHTARVSGSGVAPGEGDSEAGSLPSRRT